CFGGSDGSAAISVTGGTPGYSYNWSNGRTTSSVNNLSAGLYTVTVTDNNSCFTSYNVMILQPSSLSSSITVNSNVSCNGGSNGSATASAVGGTTPYTYLWSNAATTAAISGVSAGNYTVTVTDNNGCTSTANATVTQPSLKTTSVNINAC